MILRFSSSYRAARLWFDSALALAGGPPFGRSDEKLGLLLLFDGYERWSYGRPAADRYMARGLTECRRTSCGTRAEQRSSPPNFEGVQVCPEPKLSVDLL